MDKDVRATVDYMCASDDAATAAMGRRWRGKAVQVDIRLTLG